MPASGFYEGVLLQGYTQAGASFWYDQTIVTQGYFGEAIPVSAILLSIPEVIISSQIASIGDYFPQWMDIHYRTDPSTGSLLRRFLSAPGKEILSAAYYAHKVERQRFFNNWLGEVSRGWYTSTNLFSDQITSVVVTTPVAIIYPIRCASEWEFVTSIGPAYIVDDSSYTIYFRGLNTNAIAVESVGSVTLQDGEILGGTDIYWRNDSTGVWTIEEPGSTNLLNPNIEDEIASGVFHNGIDTIVTHMNGPVTIVYPSNILQTALESAVVSVNSGPATPLEYMDYWTSLDEVGLVVDVPRLLGEDNSAYWKRLKSVYPFPGSSTEDGLKQAVGRKIGVLDYSYWNGVVALTWAGSALIGNIWAHDLPRYGYTIEEEMREQGLLYYTSKRDIEQPYILNDNVLLEVTPVSGRISAASTYSNTLLASYRYTNYTVQASDSLFTVLSRTGNTPEGIYEISWTTGIQVNTLNRKSYKETNLLDGDGRPTPLFLDLADNIRRKIEVTLGFTRWEKIHWFQPDEISPKLDYVPIPMDYEE